jgi:hypothetical protein
VVFTPATVATRSTAEQVFGLNANACPDSQGRDSRSKGDNLTGQFVPALMWLPNSIGILPAVQMQIAATDATGLHAKQHFARTRVRYWSFFDANVFPTIENRSFHAELPLSCLLLHGTVV